MCVDSFLKVNFEVSESLYLVENSSDKHQIRGFCKPRVPLSDYVVSCGLSNNNTSFRGLIELGNDLINFEVMWSVERWRKLACLRFPGVPATIA